MTQESINKLTQLEKQRRKKALELNDVEKRASVLRSEIEGLSRAIDYEIRCGGDNS